MKFQRPRSGRLLSTIGLLLISGALLSACGGGGGGSTETAGIGGTGIGVGGTGVVSGKATGFGSIHVNGGIYNIDSSQFDVDGVNYTGQAGQDKLAVGMVLQLKVETINGALTGNALEVVYDDEVEGEITGIVLNGAQKIATIFGQTVTIDEATTIFDGNGNPGFDFSSVGVPQVVEVSGFRVSPTKITATYVRFIDNVVDPGNTEVELRGPIKTLMGTPPNETFLLDGTTITTNGTTELEVPGGILVEDMYVEAKGKIQNDASVIADKIEEEDEDFDEDVDEISLQGIISMFNSIADFQIDGQAIDASQVSPANMSPANAASLLDDGVEVEVEGDLVNGVLIADELELRGGEAKLRSFVSFVYADNIRFEVNYTGLSGSIVVHTNGQTLFEDEGPLQLPNFSVADMNVGDYVIVKGIESADEVTAETVKRKDSADPDDSELEGQVDKFIFDTSITVLGVAYNVTGADFEDATGTVSSAVFFGQLAPGVLVEIKDEEPADGIAEEVELE